MKFDTSTWVIGPIVALLALFLIALLVDIGFARTLPTVNARVTGMLIEPARVETYWDDDDHGNSELHTRYVPAKYRVVFAVEKQIEKYEVDWAAYAQLRQDQHVYLTRAKGGVLGGLYFIKALPAETPKEGTP